MTYDEDTAGGIMDDRIRSPCRPSLTAAGRSTACRRRPNAETIYYV